MVSLRYYNASVPLTDLDSLESALERAVASVLWRGQYLTLHIHVPVLITICIRSRIDQGVRYTADGYCKPFTICNTGIPSGYYVINSTYDFQL